MGTRKLGSRIHRRQEGRGGGACARCGTRRAEASLKPRDRRLSPHSVAQRFLARWGRVAAADWIQCTAWHPCLGWLSVHRGRDPLRDVSSLPRPRPRSAPPRFELHSMPMIFGETGLEHDRTLAQIARGLTWIGAAFVAASAAVIVWAVFRTTGVDDLVVALTVAGLGLGLPAIVAFVVAWILNSLGHEDAEAADQEAEPDATATARMNLASVALGYGVAVFASVVAWALRAALDPLLGNQVAYAPLLLSVAFTAWFGGLGPAVLATILGGLVSWYAYLNPNEHFGALSIQDSVQLGLYGAAALCIGGIASALRAARERAQSLAREVLAREAGLEKTRAELAAERDRSQVTLQAIAEAVIATDAEGSITFVNDCA